MSASDKFPEEFQACIDFHGHVCPGLAIGYVAAKAGIDMLGLSRSGDEEVVAVVENDSCAVDAVQVLLGCTFGKGNFIFRDWGKQVFTFIDRTTSRAVRASFSGGKLPGGEKRRALKKKIDSGQTTDADFKEWEESRKEAVLALINADPGDFFQLEQVQVEMPPLAAIMSTKPCEDCGEATVTTRLENKDGRLLCRGCAGSTA
ncbi:FmdE family protein [Thermodesulfobacteriota bacterium]